MSSYYYVVRVYSHTDRKLLWKVLSRPIKNLHDAEFHMRFMQSQEPKCKREFFIIQKEEDFDES